MTSTERLLATDLRRFNRQYGGQGKGSLSDYLTVYHDFCRADGDWSKTFTTKLYQMHSCEYCTLLEVLNSLYADHRKQVIA